MVNITRKDIARRMREVLKDARMKRRELTLTAQSDGDAGCLEASGAIRLHINDFLPTLNNSLELPPGLEVDTGVTGNEVWPVSINDVEMEEEGENAELNDQSLGFAQTRGADPVRTGITVEVSNTAIDSAGFDLLSYVQKKFELAQRRYIASHLYSTARWDGNNGPFSAEHHQQWSIPSDSLYDSIVAQMTALEEMGFDTSEACIVVDFNMERRMKYTPIRENEGRMIIQDGLCCGYPYVANKYFNTELNEQGVLVNKGDDAIGIAIFKWFKIAQHDKARLIIDGITQADRNVTSITLNTAWSFTDLSEKINGGSDMQAFHTLIMERGYLADVGDHIFETSDGKLLTVGMSRFNMRLADVDNVVLDANGNQLVVSIG